MSVVYLILIGWPLIVEAVWIIDPFRLDGRYIRWCWSCCGWGSEPGGHCCNVCFGAGFKAKQHWFIRAAPAGR